MAYWLGCRSTKSKIPGSKPLGSWKTASFFKGQSNEYQGFLGTWWIKVSPHSDSVAYRQFNYIHKMFH